LGVLGVSNQGHVKSGRVHSAFFLEQRSPMFGSGYIDFRRIYRFSKKYVASEASNGKRIASMTNEAQLALQQQLSLFFGVPRDADDAKG